MSLSTQAIQRALQNQWKEAVELNKQILVDDPQDIDAMNRLAQAYLHQGEHKQAGQWYQHVLLVDPYNPIAKRNLSKIKSLKDKPLVGNGDSAYRPMVFIEEPGKTKLVCLVQLGERAVLSQLQPCFPLSMQIRSQSICLYQEKHYVGRLPDDIGKRLIWLCDRKNRYRVYIKSIEKNKVSVFIRESRRSRLNRHMASFQRMERVLFS